MDVRDRRVAQIVRDFMLAYRLSQELGERLRAGHLDFGDVERLVGEGEESALFRLKEECHALFRFNGRRSPTELQADQLFDLAVGALFHEGMRFREGYYLTTSYGPRFERMTEDATQAPLAKAFRRVFQAGRRRMLESQAETEELFRETRDQLLALLRQIPDSGAVARSLLEDPELTDAVFGVPLVALLEQIYESRTAAWGLAMADLILNGHYEEANLLAEREEFRDLPCARVGRSFSRAIACYYRGDAAQTVLGLEGWTDEGAEGHETWRARARSVLEAIADGSAGALAERARTLLTRLRPPPA